MLPGYDILHEEPACGQDVVILPVYNELPILASTIDAISISFPGSMVVVDDASTDGSGEFLQQRKGFTLLRNRANAGAGGVLLRGFAYALAEGYERIVTMDSDGQHNACQSVEFLHALEENGPDMVWGTRYPAGLTPLAPRFRPRQEINRAITARLNEITGWGITDSFCGFRAYTRRALEAVQPVETGYGMLLELAVLAWRAGLSMAHHPVPLIYLDETRNFNEQFADAQVRRQYYFEVIARALARSAC